MGAFDSGDRCSAELSAMETARLLTNELHHRVFNNLQLLMSLVDLQIFETESLEARASLSILQSRLRSISLVNEINVMAGGLGIVDAYELAKSMSTIASQIYSTPTRNVVLAVDGPSFPMRVDTAIPLVLIASEFFRGSISGAPEAVEPGDRPISASWRVSDPSRIDIELACEAESDAGSSSLIEVMVSQIGAKYALSLECGRSVLSLSLPRPPVA
jgi:two-component sensor histidine kinase